MDVYRLYLHLGSVSSSIFSFLSLLLSALIVKARVEEGVIEGPRNCETRRNRRSKFDGASAEGTWVGPS